MTPPPLPLPWFAPQGFGDIPVGAVIAFAGRLGPAIPPSSPPGTPPDPGASPPQSVTYPLESWGWTVCDGRSLDRYHYPELFAALGYLYGGSGKAFNLPDYRGYFLRGLDPGTGADPDRDKRTAPVPGGSAEGVGSTQGCAFQQHEHQYLGASLAGAAAQGDQSSATTSQENYTTGGGAYPSDVKTSQTETRPVNVYVNYIIKFTAGLRRTKL